MQLIVVALVSFLSVLAAAGPRGKLPVPIDSRNLSDIYAAAQKETGVLQVVYGGDGTTKPPSPGRRGTDFSPIFINRLSSVTKSETNTIPEHNQADTLSQAFATQFPNVKVNFTVDLSKYLDGRINDAILQDGLYADVAILQTLQDFDAWKGRGLLLNYKPPAFDYLWSSLSDVDGAYIPAFGSELLGYARKWAWHQVCPNSRRI